MAQPICRHHVVLAAKGTDDLLHYSEPRTLTVRENARLQTFPDWYSFQGKYTTGGHLRKQEVPRFTQVANAVEQELICLVASSVCRTRETRVRVGQSDWQDPGECPIHPTLQNEVIELLLLFQGWSMGEEFAAKGVVQCAQGFKCESFRRDLVAAHAGTLILNCISQQLLS
ncbi:DNA cytosine methyltransferase [Roseateles noduli]|uniref:DNA cytosine methyltransferase n=1 Tax=Roseateles noduli TaxID=2052484 RepID=UPI003D653969